MCYNGYNFGFLVVKFENCKSYQPKLDSLKGKIKIRQNVIHLPEFCFRFQELIIRKQNYCESTLTLTLTSHKITTHDSRNFSVEISSSWRWIRVHVCCDIAMKLYILVRTGNGYKSPSNSIKVITTLEISNAGKTIILLEII